MMSPIQLQDVARKQFEDRERRRAQQAEDRLRDFRSGRFQPPNREKMSFNKATPHFFSAGVTPPNAGAFLDAAVFERLETC